MNILVSGATGMLGRVIVKDCLSNSFNVSTIGRSNPEIPEVDHINYDFSNSSFSQIKSKKTFDFIIHCAAILIIVIVIKILLTAMKSMPSLCWR